MKLGEFLNTQATQSGIQSDNEDLKSLLSSETISNYDIPDTIVNAINSSFLTKDAAKNDPSIASHYKATVLNGLDTEIDRIINSTAIDETVKNNIINEKSSFKKVPLLVDYFKNLNNSNDDTSEQLETI